MGMILGLAEISERNRARLLADPPLVWQLVAPDDPDAYAEARARASAATFLDRLLGRKRSIPPDLELEEGEGMDADLDKSWHGLHFLFTGTSEGGEFPTSFLLEGGEEIPGEDVGYGPARALNARDTQQVAAMLRSLTDEDIAARFQPTRMLELEIYPTIWDREAENRENLGYLLENLGILRRVVYQAAERGRGLLISLS